MCFSIPAKIIEIKKNEFVLDYGFEKRTVHFSVVEDLKEGDYVIVSNKVIIKKVPEE